MVVSYSTLSAKRQGRRLILDHLFDFKISRLCFPFRAICTHLREKQHHLCVLTKNFLDRQRNIIGVLDQGKYCVYATTTCGWIEVYLLVSFGIALLEKICHFETGNNADRD